MGLRKPLPAEVNGIKIISDCGTGYLHENSRNKVRICIVECEDCKDHRKVNYYSIKNSGDGRYCPRCANTGDRNGGYKHGENGKGYNRTRPNRIWNGMKGRCEQPGNKDYPKYGARGVKVCDEWQEYIGFRDWADGRLEAEDASVERLDPNGDYTPNNCIIIPTYLQALTRRNSMSLKMACHFANDLLNGEGKMPGYTMHYMNKYGLKDHQVKQFVLYNKHKEELVELANQYPKQLRSDLDITN